MTVKIIVDRNGRGQIEGIARNHTNRFKVSIKYDLGGAGVYQDVVTGTGVDHEQQRSFRVIREAGRLIEQSCVMLKVSGAFHTSHMAPAAEAMARAVSETTFRDPQAPVIANTSGEPITNAAELPGELVQQLDHAVRWQRSMEYMVAQGVTGVIEFGPGRVLTGLAKRIERSLIVRNVGDLAGAQAEDAGD